MSARADAYQEVTDRIIAALEEGVVPWRRPWRSIGGPRSYAGRPYRGVNVWLLELESMDKGYTDPRWVTFNAAKAAGGTVRRGERSTTVYFWMRSLVSDPNGEPDEDGNEATRPVFWMRAYRVFNVEQCDGLEPYVAPEVGKFEPIARAAQLVNDYLAGDGPSLREGGDRAAYSPGLDVVFMPAGEAFESSGAYYATMFHELTHSTGHKSRLDRPEVQAPAFGTEPYAREELVAELGAAMLCGVAGVDRGELQESASYIASWLHKLRDDRKLIVGASAAAQKAADMIAGVTFDDRDDENGHRGADPAPVTVRSFEPDGHRPMVARFAGSCGYCGSKVRKGEPMHYSRKVEPADRVACVACVERAAPVAEPVRELVAAVGVPVAAPARKATRARVRFSKPAKRAPKGTSLGVAGPFADRQRRAYVEAVGREPRTIREVLAERGETDPTVIAEAVRQWTYVPTRRRKRA